VRKRKTRRGKQRNVQGLDLATGANLTNSKKKEGWSRLTGREAILEKGGEESKKHEEEEERRSF